MYLTFDIGTTSLKTALVSSDGRLLSVHTSEYTPISPMADWAEMRPDDYWNAAREGTSAVLSDAEISAHSIKAVGLCSQGQTFIPIAFDGTPLHNFIVWTDMRSQDIVDDWSSNWLTKDDFFAVTGYPWIPAPLTIFKIAWFAKHRPEILQAWKFLFAPDYLLFKLTGEAVTDPETACVSGLFNWRKKAWEPQFLESAGIDETKLPKVVDFCSVGGEVTKSAAAIIGIPPGTPVCVGCNDQLAGAIGAGNVRPGVITETTGTSLAVTATTLIPLDDARVTVSRHVRNDACYARVFTGTSAIILKWFRDMCDGTSDYTKFLAGTESIPPGCEGLVVLPHFAGGGPPDFNPHIRGALVGLTLGHTRDHISRAIMESCGCMLKECLEPLVDNGLEVSCVRSLGGGARLDLWLQIKADMLGIPVQRPLYSDAGSLGAAMMAAVATHQFPNIVEAADAWYRPGETFVPNPKTKAAYEEVFDRYRSLQKAIYG